MSKLKEKLMLSEKGYSDLKKAITACTITNIALLLPSMVACLLFWELLKPFTGEAISWDALWKLLGLGVVAAILVFLAAKNDYRKTYIASYKEASTTKLRIAEHLRKLPMSFFNTKDLSDITTNMMADCSSMESMLSSTIPPLIANIISVTLTCICLAFFDWRMALAIFSTMPITFLIIWCGRKLQLRLFDKQVDVKLEASSQIQEYLEAIKIIKSCGLSGSRFSTLDKALQAMRKIAIRVELASGILVQGASLVLQAGLGITIFIGTVLITCGQIEPLPLLVLFMFSTQIYGPILAILSQLTSLFHLGTVTNRMRTLLTTPATVTTCNVKGERVTIKKDKAKNKSSLRTYPLIPFLKERLLEAKKQQEENRKLCGRSYNKEYLGYVCIDVIGNLIKPNYVSSTFGKLLAKNNLRHIRFHDLRHTCASLLLANGVPMEQVKEWLGHSEISTTVDIYGHLQYATKKQSAAAIEQDIVAPMLQNLSAVSP